MENLTYPVIYFELDDNTVLGGIVGTRYQVVDSDIRAVKGSIKDWLQKQYKKYDWYLSSNIEQYKMKVFEVKIRPTYRNADRSFPSSFVLKVPVVAIFGQTNEDYYECHLPLLGERFVYYDAKLLPSLVQNFATNLLTQQTPESLFRQLTNAEAKLDEISFRVNLNRDYGFKNNWNFNRRFQALESMAEQYPYPKSVRRNLAIFPEVAWELEDMVETAVDKIIGLKANLLVVGDTGVGKSSLLRQAIKKITAPANKYSQTFWQLMTQRITANARYLGEWQENVERLIEELQSAEGILWVVDVIQLLQTGGEGAEDSIAAFILPYMQQGKLQLIAEVSPTQLDIMRRLLPGFVENFQIMNIQEMPEAKIYSILEKFGDYTAQNMKISLPRPTLETCYRLLNRYYPYEKFPGKAIKFLSQMISQARNKQPTGEVEINREDILAHFISQTGMPELFLRDDILLDNQDLGDFFSKRIVGQTEAIETLCNVVKIFKAGLNNPQKPISTMIFTGPTGVGKTAATKALADYFFGKGQKKSPLVRIDMSEFQHPAQLARFIGAGGEVGKLIQDIRERPFSVLLLDEIEKADASVFDVLLTVLDEGRLVDAYGRSTNFCNTIIIMTSNLGASNRSSIGFGGNNSPNYESAIAQFFRPEFVNRIDHIVPFGALSQEHIAAITLKELSELQDREGFEKRGLKLTFSNAIVAKLTEVGFDIRYGARPLQRAIEQQVTAPLAKWLLANPQVMGKKLSVDLQNDELKVVIL
jgi:ATP-dependent Clp protease ATP-binding subunit ClpC